MPDCRGNGNCYVGATGGAWFRATSSWSLKHYPDFPEGVFVNGGKTVKLTKWARGAAKQVEVNTASMIDIGVASPRAQGQAMISTATAETSA